jgi:GT2 family glycosyltransferase
MISLVICSIDRRKLERVMAMFGGILKLGSYEMIAITDARSMCEGYNRGLVRARGEVVIFCHDDIEIITADFQKKLTEYLAQYDVIGVAGATQMVSGLWSAAGPPHMYGQIVHGDENGNLVVSIFSAPSRVQENIAALDGVLIGARAEVARAIGFDEHRFRGFHMYDSDFTFRAYVAGHKLAVCNDIFLVHHSRGRVDEQFHRDLALFEEKHRGKLAVDLKRQFVVCEVLAKDRKDAIGIMTPGHWNGASAPQAGILKG